MAASGCASSSPAVCAGLDVRAALLRDGDDLVVAIVGNHDDIRRWLKSV